MTTDANLPNEYGRYGVYGGRFVNETLMPAVNELEKVYIESKSD